MLKLGITGGIACGKSLAAEHCAKLGVAVCDADDLARASQRAGTDVHARIVEAFGGAILRADGELDRARLGALVFADAAARARLEAIVHPPVRKAWRDWLREREDGGERAAAVVIPLLYENGYENGWDFVVCVAAPEWLQAERLRGRGLDREGAWARIRAQLPVEEKMKRADRVIYNAGSRALLEAQVGRAVRSILET